MGSKFWCSRPGKTLLEDEVSYDIRISRKKWFRRESLGDTRFVTNDVSVQSAICQLLEDHSTITDTDISDALLLAMSVKKAHVPVRAHEWAKYGDMCEQDENWHLHLHPVFDDVSGDELDPELAVQILDTMLATCIACWALALLQEFA